MSDGGKGSTQRPMDRKKFEDNFDRIFRKKDKEKKYNKMTGLSEEFMEKITQEWSEALKARFEELQKKRGLPEVVRPATEYDLYDAAKYVVDVRRKSR
jgi:vacuolar-type H+-ATPase catalytic subunit A/Vma1